MKKFLFLILFVLAANTGFGQMKKQTIDNLTSTNVTTDSLIAAKFRFLAAINGYSVFFDDFMASRRTWSGLQTFMEDSTWASGFKKAVRMMGVNPGFYMLETSTNRAAGFTFSAGVWRFHIGSTATSLGTTWLDASTGTIKFPSSIGLLFNHATGNLTSDYMQVNGNISPVLTNTSWLGNPSYRWIATYTNGLATKVDSTVNNNVNVTIGNGSFTKRIKTGGSDRTATLLSTGLPDGSIYVITKAQDTTGNVIVKAENGGLISGNTVDIISEFNEVHTYQQVGINFILLNVYKPTSTKAPLINSNFKIARVGTSLTADGDYGISPISLLGQSFTTYLYKTIASFAGPVDVNLTGINYTITNSRLLDGSALKLRGANASLKCTMYGDEITLITAKERNNVGASIIDVYIDGSLHDSFSNYNEEPSGTLNFTATGDGTKTKFSLGKKFCYNPRSLTVNGVSKTVIHQTSNSNLATNNFAGNDAMIIRKYQKVNGQAEVVDYVWFAVAPPNGHAVALTVDYGENICFTQCTLSEVKDSLNSTIEASYGDVLLDSTAATISADNLSYRYTDDRAVRTYKFSSYKSRNIEVKIRGLDARASGNPYFIFNGITNRFQKIMNAGISGYRAFNVAYNDPTADLRTYVPIQDWKPNITLLEHGANDNGGEGVFNIYIATKAYAGLSEQTVRDYPVKWIKSVTFQDPTYTINSSALTISAVTKNSVTVGSGVTYDSIPKAGDIIYIGTYHIDNREITSRVITSWDTASKTATFKEPLTVDEFISIRSLNDLVGQDVKIFRPWWYESSMNLIIDKLKDANPNNSIAVVSTILQNEYLRTSYNKKISQIANTKGIMFGDIYEEIKKWQYSQARTKPAYLTTASNVVSNGSTSYTLVDSAGGNPIDFSQKKYWSVKVNGVERYGNGCYIEGGVKGSMGNSIAANQLTVASFAAAWAKFSNDLTTAKLVFTTNTPANGDTIIVKCAPQVSTDDNTHPNITNGIPLYFNIYREILRVFFNSKKDL